MGLEIWNFEKDQVRERFLACLLLSFERRGNKCLNMLTAGLMEVGVKSWAHVSWELSDITWFRAILRSMRVWKRVAPKPKTNNQKHFEAWDLEGWFGHHRDRI